MTTANRRSSFNPLTAFLGGATAAGALMYLFDPDKGARRRAVGRDKILSAALRSERALRVGMIDLSNRTQGWLHDAQASLTTDHVASDVLVARIWAHVGGLVSHPRALNITADPEGVVTVSGQILSAEAGELLSAVARVAGVSTIDNRLELHQRAENVPSLQGGALRRSPLRSQDRRYWPPAVRLVAGSLGAAMAAYGTVRRRPSGALALGLGSALVLRSLSNMELLRFFGIRGGRRVVDLHKTIHIEKPVEQVFGFWTDFQHSSKVLDHVYSVEEREPGHLRWKIAGPLGIPINWDAEITRVVPNELIAWKTLPGSIVAGAGVIRFEALNDNATRVDIRMSYNPPGGMLGHFIAVSTGSDPKHAMEDDLVRVKSFLEKGKTRAHGHRITNGELAGEP
jgi:uncharacterized membrane protein